MSWRPEGWKNPWKNIPFPPIDPITENKVMTGDIFEEGANAMLEALKEKGAWMTPEQMKLLAPDRMWGYGHIVFIPEDKETAATTIINAENSEGR